MQHYQQIHVQSIRLFVHHLLITKHNYLHLKHKAKVNNLHFIYCDIIYGVLRAPFYGHSSIMQYFRHFFKKNCDTAGYVDESYSYRNNFSLDSIRKRK